MCKERDDRLVQGIEIGKSADKLGSEMEEIRGREIARVSDNCAKLAEDATRLKTEETTLAQEATQREKELLETKERHRALVREKTDKLAAGSGAEKSGHDAKDRLQCDISKCNEEVSEDAKFAR